MDTVPRRPGDDFAREMSILQGRGVVVMAVEVDGLRRGESGADTQLNGGG
jgi:hypothetical protein